MKIQKIAFRKHFLFGSIDIDLIDSSGKPLDTVVFAGNNGCGKTTLLVEILELITGTKDKEIGSFAILNMQSLVDKNLLQPSSNDLAIEPNFVLNESGNAASLLKKRITKISEDERPKVIYMPAEISLDKLTVKEKAFDYKYSFKNVIDKKHVNEIPTYISSIIKDAVFKNEDLPAKTSIKKVCAEINQIFEDLEIDARLTGLAEEGEKLPVFANSAGASFDINGLSSGEKQLFARALTLRMLRANNSIILVDEPEISLHPRWQQKILRVYERIGKNNQVIIATHSPHILSACGKESGFLLARENGKVKVYNHQQLNSVYGKPVSVVLMDFMGLKTLRSPEIELQFEDVRQMVRDNKTDSEPFKRKMAALIDVVGEIDEDIILLKMELARVASQKGGKNA
jgi:predicted ATP-binding protein involved in virulence